VGIGRGPGVRPTSSTRLSSYFVDTTIVGGQRDLRELAKLRDPHIRASEETIRKSLKGKWRGSTFSP